MTISDNVGVIAFLVTVAYTCWGLPLQIHDYYVSKSTGKLSPIMVALMFFTFSSWVVYGLTKIEKDLYIVGSNLPGAVFALVIFFQVWYYRRKA